MVSEREIPSQENREAWQIYEEIIKPGNKVVVIGPSTTIYDKPALLYVCTLIGNTGEVFIADPQWEKSEVSHDEMEENLGQVSGIGDWAKGHHTELKVVRKKGIPLTKPKWLGPKSGAQKMQLPDNSIDVIVDHTVSVFLAGTPHYVPDNERGNNLRRIYTEYHRVLKPGGRLILQTDLKEYEFQETPFQKGLLTTSLETSGLKVEKRHDVKDMFKIPIPNDVYDRWAPRTFKDLGSSRSQEEQESCFIFSRIKQENGQYFLVLDKPWSTGPNMFICVNPYPSHTSHTPGVI